MVFFFFVRMCDYSFFFFSSRRRHTRCGRDWNSDVCSSDLGRAGLPGWADAGAARAACDCVQRCRVAAHGGAAARLWRGGGEAGERLAAPLAGFWREAGCGAAGVLVLAGVECGEDALVADGEQA